MGIFGWSLPPGCTQRHIDEACGYDEPCDVCGQPVDDCICPECPQCGSVGDPECYDGAIYCSWCGKKPVGHRGTIEMCSGCDAADQGDTPVTFDHRPSHGLIRTPEQIKLRTEAEALWQEDARQQAAAEAALYGNEGGGDES